MIECQLYACDCIDHEVIILVHPAVSALSGIFTSVNVGDRWRILQSGQTAFSGLLIGWIGPLRTEDDIAVVYLITHSTRMGLVAVICGTSQCVHRMTCFSHWREAIQLWCNQLLPINKVNLLICPFSPLSLISIPEANFYDRSIIWIFRQLQSHTVQPWAIRMNIFIFYATTLSNTIINERMLKPVLRGSKTAKTIEHMCVMKKGWLFDQSEIFDHNNGESLRQGIKIQAKKECWSFYSQYVWHVLDNTEKFQNRK